MHPGIRLLLEIGASRPELLLIGKVLTDQGRVLAVMMESGWSSEQLRHVITSRSGDILQDEPSSRPVIVRSSTASAART
ncbi:hypothetical protein AB8A21_23995 [Streptomyces sp. BF23-18]|uniref:hypothetical protein n=1 Tax=Streptomyces sp. BF23-18 TaxID=3240282 RepID=UPI0034E489D7